MSLVTTCTHGWANLWDVLHGKGIEGSRCFGIFFVALKKGEKNFDILMCLSRFQKNLDQIWIRILTQLDANICTGLDKNPSPGGFLSCPGWICFPIFN